MTTRANRVRAAQPPAWSGLWVLQKFDRDAGTWVDISDPGTRKEIETKLRKLVQKKKP